MEKSRRHKIIVGDQYRQYFLQSLERVNKFVRTIFKKAEAKAWIAASVQSTMDQLCRDESVGSRFNYDGEGEIGISLGKFGSTHQKFRLSALDASYQVNPALLTREIPNFMSTLCA